MHPVTGEGRRLGWYLVAWVPLGGLLALLLHAGAGLTPGAAAALAAPLALVYAFASLAVWYPCRVLPLGGNPWPAVGTHLAAALVAGGLWALFAEGLAWAYIQARPGTAWHLPQALPLVGGLGVLVYLLAVAACYLALGREAAGEAERRAILAQAHAAAAVALAREAELRALKAQINPHFLFNSLNSISALTATDPARAREMCVGLGDFLRQTLALGGRDERALVALEEELELVRAYVAIEQVRFGERLRVEEAVSAEALRLAVPPLLLQPLVENAVVHGVAHLLEGGWIRLEGDCREGRLRLEVSNGFDPDAPRRASTGLGLANVRGRLAARYGGRAAMEVSASGGCFRARLELPGEAMA